VEPQLACRVCCSYRVNANREQSSDHDNTSHFQGKWSDQLQRYSIQSGPSLLNVMLDTAKHLFQPLRLIVESLMLPNLSLKYVALENLRKCYCRADIIVSHLVQFVFGAAMVGWLLSKRPNLTLLHLL